MASNGDDRGVSKDVIIDVLSRLPVKTLMRFKCVCKHWSEVVKSSNFVIKHLHCNNGNNAYLFVQRYSYSNQNYAFATFPYDKIATIPPSYREHENLHIPINPSVVGSVNGLLCLWDRTHIAMWNPTLRELRPLSIPQPDLPSHFKAWCHHFGLGLDPAHNYKLVWLRYFWDEKHDNPYQPTVVSVYTQGTDTWRVFEADLTRKGFIYDSLCNTYMKGVYYWLTIEDDNTHKMLIFDMDKEVFRDIPGPSDIVKSQLGQLAMYRDYIALFVFDPSEADKCFDIWVMKEEGSWSRLATTRPLPDMKGPLGLSKDEDIFLEGEPSQFVLYNNDTQEMKRLGPSGKDYSIKVCLYEDSLVSVKRETECWDGDNLVWLEFKTALNSIYQS